MPFKNIVGSKIIRDFLILLVEIVEKSLKEKVFLDIIGPLHMTRNTIRVRLPFHLDFFGISLISIIFTFSKINNISYVTFIIFHAKNTNILELNHFEKKK